MAFSISSLLSSSPRLSSSLLSSSPLLHRQFTTSFLSQQKTCFDNKNNNNIWLRDEVLYGERRTALTPEHAKELIDEGFEITVEESQNRIFPTEQYEKVGCKVVSSGAWMEGKAPEDHFILGLKTLGEKPTVCEHRHIYFAHAFKGQSGWQNEIRRFKEGGGTILDLEFLVNDQGRRLAAFGFFAGYAGMAVGLRHLAVKDNEQYPSWSDFPTKDDMVKYVAHNLDEEAKEKLKKVVVVGALGGVGSGACQAYDDVVAELGMSNEHLSRWDIKEMSEPTARPALLQHHLMVNSILVSGPLEPFVTKENINTPRILEHIVDVSCDSTNPNNPLPIYPHETTFEEPAVKIEAAKDGIPRLDVTAISHLPSLLPKESSEYFSTCLLPSLKKLKRGGEEWERAERIFEGKVGELE